MIIIAGISGIQDYLFHVQESGGRQAKSLRFRSLYIQLVAEAVAVRLLRAAGLNDDHLIYCAAGKIAIHGAGLDGHRLDSLSAEAREISLWLRDKTHARLRLSMAIGEHFDAANQSFQKSKHRGWSDIACCGTGWQSSRLRSDSPPNVYEEAVRDAKLGLRAVQPDIRHVLLADGNDGDIDVVGLRADFAANPSSNGAECLVRPMAKMARHVPVDANGSMVEFAELARLSRGAAMLGVLKADVDSLGAAIGRCLAGGDDLRPLKVLSDRLETFFASDLDQQMRKDHHWSKLYTVFSGGDDLLLIGPWDIALDFAGHLQSRFTRAFTGDRLTISAGVAIIKPKFPVQLAARQADDLLTQAKSISTPRASESKNQCAALGGLWKWSDHEHVISAGKKLADWVDQDMIKRGWLHTLLQCTLLRRGEIPGTPHHQQVLATARLAYHVARNWSICASARPWVEDILREFDRYETTKHVQTIHLPAIIRYALLATRSSSDKE